MITIIQAKTSGTKVINKDGYFDVMKVASYFNVELITNIDVMKVAVKLL